MGKRIILIDDSIVRGNTIAPIVKLLKQAGAKEVDRDQSCHQVNRKSITIQSQSTPQMRVRSHALGDCSDKGMCILGMSCPSRCIYEHCILITFHDPMIKTSHNFLLTSADVLTNSTTERANVKLVDLNPR